MKTNVRLSALFLSAALVCAPAFAVPFNPAQDPGPKQDMKNAGHDTKNATKDAAHDTANGTRHTYHKAKRHTKRAYHRTKNATTGAVDGAKDGARNPQ